MADAHVEMIVERFEQGLGASIPYTDSFGKQGTVYLVPGPLLGPDVRGLLIVLNGRGSMVWDGVNPSRLNEFKLVSFGVKPLETAKHIAGLLNAVMDRFTSKQIQNNQKYLAAKKDD